MQRSSLELSPQDDGIAALAAGVSLHSSKKKSGVRPSGCLGGPGAPGRFCSGLPLKTAIKPTMEGQKVYKLS